MQSVRRSRGYVMAIALHSFHRCQVPALCQTLCSACCLTLTARWGTSGDAGTFICLKRHHWRWIHSTKRGQASCLFSLMCINVTCRTCYRPDTWPHPRGSDSGSPQKCIFSHFPGEGEAIDPWTALWALLYDTLGICPSHILFHLYYPAAPEL